MNIAHLPQAELGKLPEKEEPKMSRQQRRIIDRVEKEATDTCGKLVSRFNQFLLESGTISQELVDEKIALLDKQWRFYCKINRLSYKALGIVEGYCRQAFKEFNGYAKDSE